MGRAGSLVDAGMSWGKGSGKVIAPQPWLAGASGEQDSAATWGNVPFPHGKGGEQQSWSSSAFPQPWLAGATGESEAQSSWGQTPHVQPSMPTPRTVTWRQPVAADSASWRGPGQSAQGAYWPDEEVNDKPMKARP